MVYDIIIIGGGIYGLYAALYCGKMGKKVLLLEADKELVSRATYVNQARVHMGYHYPRSFSTAIKSAHYFNRFCTDFKECINSKFTQIYAISNDLSWSNGEQFKKFCTNANIQCDEISPDAYFKSGTCDSAFITKEYTFSAKQIKTLLLNEISRFTDDNVTIKVNSPVNTINVKNSHYEVVCNDDSDTAETAFLLNTTYASVNQIINKTDYIPFKIKYELCEIILCDVPNTLKNVGLTVMDGPFFSVMPFGNTGMHSLTSVTFTPHITSYDTLPVFECQTMSNGLCSKEQLYNCNSCPAKPDSAWNYMHQLAKKYMKEDYNLKYISSLFSMKPILTETELSDARPTLITKFSDSPTFISVLSGKINTIYDLDEVLESEFKKI